MTLTIFFGATAVVMQVLHAIFCFLDDKEQIETGNDDNLYAKGVGISGILGLFSAIVFACSPVLELSQNSDLDDLCRIGLVLLYIVVGYVVMCAALWLAGECSHYDRNLNS